MNFDLLILDIFYILSSKKTCILFQAKAYSNTLVLGLRYEPQTEKLSLKILRASIASSSLHQNQGMFFNCWINCFIRLKKCLNRLRIAILFIASYYGKVTLFEGHKVVKAKKTSPVSAFSLEHKHGEMTSKSTTEPSTDACTKGKDEQDKLEKVNQNPEFQVMNILYFPSANI